MKSFKNKKSKRLIVLLLLIAAVSVGAVAAFASDQEITVTVNGDLVAFDQPPIITDSRTLVPMRAIFEKLGCAVDWDGQTRTVTATRADIRVELTIGKSEMYRNGETIQLEVPATIVNSRTLIPIRAVAEALDCAVDWDSANRKVIIATNETTATTIPTPTGEAERPAGYVDPERYAETGEYSKTYRDTVVDGYYYNKQGFRIEEADYNKMLAKRNSIYAGAIKSGMSEFEKVKAMHDWLCENVSYNYNYFNNQSTWKPTKYNFEHQTAWAALMLNTAVCAGYADAYQFLLEGLGIDSTFIHGTVPGLGGHAWNIVRVQGSRYHVDVTWNDADAGTRYDFFLISDALMSGSYGHSRVWNKNNFPKCPDVYPFERGLVYYGGKFVDGKDFSAPPKDKVYAYFEYFVIIDGGNAYALYVSAGGGRYVAAKSVRSGETYAYQAAGGDLVFGTVVNGFFVEAVEEKQEEKPEEKQEEKPEENQPDPRDPEPEEPDPTEPEKDPADEGPDENGSE